MSHFRIFMHIDARELSPSQTFCLIIEYTPYKHSDLRFAVKKCNSNNIFGRISPYVKRSCEFDISPITSTFGLVLKYIK